ncbi:MAG: glycogen synthase GlgA [Clostridia bacterium]|nr:glycogen synthase GlgA [Clostridia bacterium]
MKILFTASECVPFIKTGGLADVVGALAPVLAAEGHDVRVMIPLYNGIQENFGDEMTHELEFEVQLGWRRQYCGVEKLVRDGVTYYFIDNKFYFGRSYIYGLGGDEYERFGFFCRSCLNALPLLDFQPDVIHAHDWQSGMVPALLKIQYAHLPFFSGIHTMFTIHNLQYQGIFGIREVQDVLGLGDSLWTDDKLECFGCANFLKAGLVYSDIITTVSPSYAEEIQTAYYGERLEGLLRARKQEVYGVLNGLDVVDYDPSRDQNIASTFTPDDLTGKAACKAVLQQEMDFVVDPDIPIIGMVGRLTNQKGLDLVDCVISDIMQENVQLVVLGMGDNRYVNLFMWASDEFKTTDAEGNEKHRVAARFSMDSALAHRIYAGCDMFLMPSQFEPCGLSQMIALRYGTIPIVRETGGLRDTVLAYNPENGEGNGFTFFNYNAHDMLYVIREAIECYHNNKEVWKTLQLRGMTTDFSWTRSANRYLQLYAGMSGASEMPSSSEPAEIPAEEAPVEVAPVEEKKTRKVTRRTAKKAEEPKAEDKPDEEAKPAKKRATRKAAEPKAEEQPAEEAKPAKKRATKKAEEPKAEDKPAEEAKPARKRTTKKAEEPKAEEQPKEAKPARKRATKKAEEPKAE